jgi:hypothetical protein
MYYLDWISVLAISSQIFVQASSTGLTEGTLSFLCCLPVSFSAKTTKSLFFLDDSTDNPIATVAGRIGYLVIRSSMDDQRSAAGCEQRGRPG